jgi:hypothetical protein
MTESKKKAGRNRKAMAKAATTSEARRQPAGSLADSIGDSDLYQWKPVEWEDPGYAIDPEEMIEVDSAA